MNLISNAENNAIVNLEKVTYIHTEANEKTNSYNICFVFDSSLHNGMNEAVWYFNSLEEMLEVINQINYEEY